VFVYILMYCDQAGSVQLKFWCMLLSFIKSDYPVCREERLGYMCTQKDKLRSLKGGEHHRREIANKDSRHILVNSVADYGLQRHERVQCKIEWLTKRIIG
jgi:hypothetical protein